MTIMKADTDKPHRCPRCWRIPDILWEQHSRARYFTTYTCPNGHRFAMWRRLPTWYEVRHRWFIWRNFRAHWWN